MGHPYGGKTSDLDVSMDPHWSLLQGSDQVLWLDWRHLTFWDVVLPPISGIHDPDLQSHSPLSWCLLFHQASKLVHIPEVIWEHFRIPCYHRLMQPGTFSYHCYALAPNVGTTPAYTALKITNEEQSQRPSTFFFFFFFKPFYFWLPRQPI